MVGATLLARPAALHSGAGKVWLGLLDQSLTIDPLQPELMILEAKMLLATHKPTHLLIGPGLGQSSEAIDLLSLCLKSNTPLIIDTDGLNGVFLADSKKPDSFESGFLVWGVWQ